MKAQLLTKELRDKLADATYIKLCVNKTHMGPVSEAKIANAKASTLCAAANKVRVMADFTIKVETDKDKDTSPKANNSSWLVKELGDDSPNEVAIHAVYLMQAWDKINSEEGTPDYMSKLAKTVMAKADAYSKLGINPTLEKKPDLTKDQRTVYNSIVGPTGFDYYEYHLAFKVAGQAKFARSKTFRSLKPLDLGSLLSKLSKESTNVSNRITITTRQTN